MPRADLPDFVLFGGSFNPVHSGHIEIVRQLSALPTVAQVLVVPSGRSPFKPNAFYLPAALRYRMVCAATANITKVAVLDWELRRPPPSYTVDTVALMRQGYPKARLWVAMGMDVFQSFADWHQAAALLDMAGGLVFRRAGTDEQALSPSQLPHPWDSRTQRDPSGHLTDSTGRRVVWLASVQVPAIASSDILRARDLTHVPSPAQAMLAEHWRQISQDSPNPTETP